MENATKCILVTGGLGYIGSHVVSKLLKKGYNVVIVDYNESIVLDRIEFICNKRPIFYKMDIRSDKLDIIFSEHNIIGVIHLAGLKSVNESILYPLDYYDNNVYGTINLLNIMKKYNVYNLIFSSSATVYGIRESVSAITEKDTIGQNITNPYGETKYVIEKILMSLNISDKRWKITSLRYFNPVGSHKSRLLGDNPDGIPANLMPRVCRVAFHNNIKPINDVYSRLKIFGGNYPTYDGTCVRDFIHISDLANSHISALGNFLRLDGHYKIYNVGTGKGISVLELINVFVWSNELPKLPYDVVEKREGDIGVVYCDNSLIKEELDWYPKKSVVDMCKDSWNFYLTNSTEELTSSTNSLTLS